MKIITVTGHRPGGLFVHDTYSKKSEEMIVSFSKKLLVKLRDIEPNLTIRTGMALGYDIAIAEACISLSIPFEAWVPFETQDYKWPAPARARYRLALTEAAEVIIVSEGLYHHSFLQLRNEAMIRGADEIAALWNGEQSGGTYKAIQYAQKLGVPVENYWKAWVKMRKDY